MEEVKSASIRVRVTERELKRFRELARKHVGGTLSAYAVWCMSNPPKIVGARHE